VPKYDAFGREIGEDTLAGLGGNPEEKESAWQERTEREEATWEAAERVEVARLEAAATAEDAQAEAAEDARQAAAGDSRWTAPATPTITVRRSGTARGCLITIVVVLLIGGAAAAGILSLVSSVDIDGGTDAIIKRIEPPTADDGPKPTGLGEGSLMRRADLAAALTQLRSSENTKLTNLRVAPERIDATLLTNEGRLRHVQITPGGKLRRFGSDGSPGFDNVPTISFSRLNPGAPERLARRGAKAHGVPLSELQYAVPQDISGKVRWVVYFTRGRYVLGNGTGRFERKLP
jgi:hypothetical protein